MAVQLSDRPWVLTALPREQGPLRRRARSLAPLGPRAWRCQLATGPEFVLAETGVGGDATRRSLDALFALAKPTAALLCGFAGALADDLSVGDAVAATAVLDEAGHVWRSPLAPLPGLRTGTLVTSPTLIATVADKRALRVRTGADAVDMETSAFAEWCDAHAVPWSCVRAVSDDARTELSQATFDLLEDGRVRVGRLVWALLRRPSLIRELVTLGRHTARAADTLADVAEAWLA